MHSFSLWKNSVFASRANLKFCMRWENSVCTTHNILIEHEMRLPHCAWHEAVCQSEYFWRAGNSSLGNSWFTYPRSNGTRSNVGNYYDFRSATNPEWFPDKVPNLESFIDSNLYEAHNDPKDSLKTVEILHICSPSKTSHGANTISKYMLLQICVHVHFVQPMNRFIFKNPWFSYGMLHHYIRENFSW